MKIQPRISGSERRRMESRFISEIKETIDSIAAMYNCSKSFVIATLVADALGIKEQVRYYNVAKRVKSKSRSRGRKSKTSGVRGRTQGVVKDFRYTVVH